MRIPVRAATLAIAAGCGLLACYPERPSESGDYSSVTTIYDVTMDFDTVPRFYLPDSVVHVGPVGATDNLPRTYDSLSLARIASNMTSRGYARVGDPDSADITLNPVAILTDHFAVESVDWCSVWAWAYPLWTCTVWVPDYPTDVIGYEYSAGTLFIPMADLRGGVPPAVSPPVVWLAGLNGVLDASSGSALAQALSDGINQAFAQSPYIRTTP